ncbi:hypothetical protein RHSIM_Rhsim03G0100900 [Rhododendron simsii]|uniref:Scaffold protein Nfu/NifU N-terminal domain-containing protein n=1 Tax=Rhododendron simsii TaxID=118357 RepID=A0A834LSG3_RHOSS|nr:hypothetical protein RHSIM_Rhsim03G0100900 [Rhododendron simsii]
MKSLRILLGRGLVCRRTEPYTGSGAPYTSSRLLLLDFSATSTLQNRSALSALPSFKIKSTSIPPFHSSKWDLLRGLFILEIYTFNPSSLMFYLGKQVMEVGCADFPNAHSAMNSPLAKALFGIDGNKATNSFATGVTRVFFGSNFITITKSDDVAWDILKPEISAAIEDFYSSGKPPFLDSNTAASMDRAIHKVKSVEQELDDGKSVEQELDDEDKRLRSEGVTLRLFPRNGIFI